MGAEVVDEGDLDEMVFEVFDYLDVILRSGRLDQVR